MIEAAEKMGLPYNPDQNGATQEGIGMSQVTITRGRRQSTAFCYLDPARGRANLQIDQGAIAESLILEGRRCVGVRYSVNGEKREARPRARSSSRRPRSIRRSCSNSPASAKASGCARSASHRCTSCRASARTCATIIRRA